MLRQGKGSQLSAQVFESLPHEVYGCIVDHLEAGYSTATTLDVSGRQQALRTICQVSKPWAKAAIEALYRDLWLPSATLGQAGGRRMSTSSKRRSWTGKRLSLSLGKPKTPLELLLRTIEEAPSLAYLIRRVHVPSTLAIELDNEAPLPIERRLANRLVYEVIDKCTELELITGFNPAATREKTEWCKLFFSRERLGAHAWMLDLKQPLNFSSSQFADMHGRWQWLDTLVLCKTDEHDTKLGPGMISAVTNRLPSLKHLVVSGFGKEDFHNGTLLSLSALTSLRLEKLPGVNDQGIFQLSHSRNAFSLESLSLIDLELASLPTIQTLLSNLTRLRRLRLVQDASPSLLLGTTPWNKRNALWSQTLHHLHWDNLIPGDAINVLASSVQSSHFPSLRTLKVPSDPSGTIQALCRPIARHVLTAADLRFLAAHEQQDRYVRSLRLARLQAQMRVRESRARPSFSLVVSDEEEGSEQRHVIGDYLGDVRSGIEYSLEPDVDGEEEALSSVESVCGMASTKMEGGGERVVPLSVLF